MMIDLYDLQRRNPTGAFNNFFKSRGFKEAKKYLQHMRVPSDEILLRTRPSPSVGAKAMAHPLIATEFLRWQDMRTYFVRLDNALGFTKPLPPK